MKRVTVLIFARYPEAGKVKTRMVPPLTPREAAEFHLASLRMVCERLRSCAELQRVLLVTPDERTTELPPLIGDRVLAARAQGNGSLGKRLSAASHHAFQTGAEAVLLLGADSPTLPTQYVRQAVDELSRHDSVIGPTHDGGYYLLGLRSHWPLLFERIDWGTSEVAEQTKRRAAEGKIDLAELPTWYDLDRFEDLLRAKRDLSQPESSTMPAAASLGRVIDGHLERYAKWKN